MSYELITCNSPPWRERESVSRIRIVLYCIYILWWGPSWSSTVPTGYQMYSRLYKPIQAINSFPSTLTVSPASTTSDPINRCSNSSSSPKPAALYSTYLSTNHPILLYSTTSSQSLHSILQLRTHIHFSLGHLPRLWIRGTSFLHPWLELLKDLVLQTIDTVQQTSNHFLILSV